MGVIRRRSLTRRDWTRFHINQLVMGWDFLRRAWDDQRGMPPDQKHLWPSQETLAEMRECWREKRDEVRAQAERLNCKVPWAELVFDHGVDPLEAIQLKRQGIGN